MKIDHTYRVAALAERIAKMVTDIPIDRDLAWTMGMLHDIGRFEQVYVDKLMQFASDNPDTNAWLSYMRKHLWSS